MNEENKFGPKKSWTRIFRKKWFFPSLYLMLAALLLSAVVWYQNSGDEQTESIDEGMEQSEDYVPIASEGDDAVPVMENQELIQLPVQDLDEAEIVTKFFDYNAEEAEKANALIHYNNRYYQSTGIDIANSDAEAFDVVASLSGTVKEVKKDPIMGNVVTIDHENDVTTYYASLDDVSVEQDAKVKQGDVIGTAGKNIFGKDNGIHVHFELRKAEKMINPEEFLNQPVANLYELTDETSGEAEDTEDGEVTEDSAEEVTEPENTPEQESDEDADRDEDLEREEDAEHDEDLESDEDLDRDESTDADDDTDDEDAESEE